MTTALEPAEITRHLADLTGWTGDASGLHRTVTAPTFLDGIKIVQAVAETAEAMDHHPDIDIRWTALTFGLVTHSAGGVTELDVELAHRIDAVATEHGAV
jgi:4a-hydroxytetrahydrobiopterin dehydratase